MARLGAVTPISREPWPANDRRLACSGNSRDRIDAGGSRIALSHTDVWYSSDLHMDLNVVRSDPQLGEVILQVTNLVRQEPDSSWFSVPSGYAVKGASTNSRKRDTPEFNMAQ